MAGGPNPSIRVVASVAGVSVATVSNVLNGKSNVTPEIAVRVRAAVERLGYVRDSRASRLRSGVSRLCGVIVPDLTNPMFASFVSTLEQLARSDDYDLVVVSSRNDPAEEAERLRHIREWRPAGLIVLPYDGALADRLPPGLAMPLVVADRIPDDARFDLVAVDNAAASATIVRHLAAQGAGDCLVVGTSLGISNVRERWDGAVSAAGSMSIELMEVGFEDHAPKALADRLLGERRPAALYCLDHETTLAAYILMGEVGLRPARDIAFASFDEMEWMRLVAPAVTAVRQPVEEMAECAWTMLRRRISGDDGPPHARRLRCAVTFRGSTPRQSPSRSREANSTRNGGERR
jgi:LacI family transcriptional regulator